ncbi:disease resistance protein RGA2-like [Acetobacter orientalis]|uniref:Disease resistance protein RGA2-like n=1 Tax=Acetobacter orientalis TaxID=146474 RepID=A0A2Z5ZHN2_9PROT|nr:disease resistance protein RGA2-like [Acetobacter orientalis]
MDVIIQKSGISEAKDWLKSEGLAVTEATDKIADFNTVASKTSPEVGNAVIEEEADSNRARVVFNDANTDLAVMFKLSI